VTAEALSVTRTWPGREGTSIAWSPDGTSFASAIRTEINVVTGSGHEPAAAGDFPGNGDAGANGNSRDSGDSRDNGGARDRSIVTPGPVLSLAFARSGDQLLAAPYRVDLSDGAVLVDATTALTVDLPREGAKGFEVLAAAWSPDGAVAVLAGRYRPPRGTPARQGWSGPGTRVVRSVGDAASLLWDSASAGDLVVAAGRDWLAFADTTVRVVPRSGGAGSTRESRADIRDLATHDAVARTLALDDDEKRLAVGFADGYVSVYTITDGSTVAAWRAHETDVGAVVWLGDRLLSGGADGSLRLFASDGAAIAASDPREFQPIVALAVHPSGETVRASIGGPRAELLEFDLAGA
jgi:WD40 repeat protein